MIPNARKTAKEPISKIPTQIKEKTVSYNLNLGGQKCTIRIEDALHGIVNGEEILLDGVVINEMVEEMSKCIRKNYTRYNPIPKEIVISHGIGRKKNTEYDENKIDESKCTSCYEPKWDIDDIYLEGSAKKQILSVISMIQNKQRLFEEWGLKEIFKNGRGIVLNFYGKPGTGKSVTAEAIAKYLGKKVCAVNYSELESKYVGDTPKNIKSVFETAQKEDAIIIFDEADSFLGKRLTNVSQSADYGVNITRSVMLLELEKYDGIVIFTTNLLNNYDDAFKRRILSSIEFKVPDEEGRAYIWRKHLPKDLPLDKQITIGWLAKEYEGVTGADINDIILNAAILALQSKHSYVLKEDIHEAHKYVMSRYTSESKSQIIKTERISKEQYEQIQNIN